MKDAVEIYSSLARPPVDALKKIGGGKLSGMTDINPQWRYKAMTETFGLVGIGWKYSIDKLWTEQGASNEVLAFAQVSVYLKDGPSWSEPIIGIGGSKLAQLEKGSLVSNDEGFKMAVTDAFSTALKMIGVAADIYAGRWDGSKYRDYEPAPEERFQSLVLKIEEFDNNGALPEEQKANFEKLSNTTDKVRAIPYLEQMLAACEKKAKLSA